ncbi:hypothetical protein SAMN05421690_100980 [Nitrosomonas sp. Nm51]|nr:hypothetical protein SAMN05421690_100980 [Nitrosomonas sp. Nm51]
MKLPANITCGFYSTEKKGNITFIAQVGGELANPNTHANDGPDSLLPQPVYFAISNFLFCVYKYRIKSYSNGEPL